MGTERRTGDDSAVKTRPRVQPRSRTKKPKRFKVILFNDDYTTMEFVVYVLQVVFSHPPAAAVEVMLKVHNEGRGVAGAYPHEVAEMKVLRVHELARGAGHPLRAGLEDE